MTWHTFLNTYVNFLLHSFLFLWIPREAQLSCLTPLHLLCCGQWLLLRFVVEAASMLLASQSIGGVHSKALVLSSRFPFSALDGYIQAAGAVEARFPRMHWSSIYWAKVGCGRGWGSLLFCIPPTYLLACSAGHQILGAATTAASHNTVNSMGEESGWKRREGEKSLSHIRLLRKRGIAFSYSLFVFIIQTNEMNSALFGLLVFI